MGVRPRISFVFRVMQMYTTPFQPHLTCLPLRAGRIVYPESCAPELNAPIREIKFLIQGEKTNNEIHNLSFTLRSFGMQYRQGG
jgi:hypothetical protein